MATVFTQIIEGELPGRFVWRDEQCVAFLDKPEQDPDPVALDQAASTIRRALRELGATHVAA